MEKKRTEKRTDKRAEKEMNRTEFAEEYNINTEKTNKTNKTNKQKEESFSKLFLYEH